MKKINIKEMAHIICELECGEAFDFYMSYDEITENLEEAYGVKKIKSFDAEMVVFNYYGGCAPYIIDITSVDNLLETLQEGVKDYFDYVEGADCAYIKDTDNYRCLTEECVYWCGNGNCSKERVTIACGECHEYQQKPKIKASYKKMNKLPKLNARIFVTMNGTIFYPANYLGYGAYGKDPEYKSFCVQVIKPNGCFVDYFNELYEEIRENENV